MSRRLRCSFPSVPILLILSFLPAPARGQGFAVQRQQAAPPPAPDAEAPATPEPVRYVMTISGGISLGAYEAGFNWALLRYLKKHRAASTAAGSDLAPLELVAATGASAGNINAFLTAIGWCQTSAYDDKETASENLFWKAWVPIGLETLFPGPGGEYAPDDGLFTRRAFAAIRGELARATATPERFAPSCRLPIGITVTRNRLGSIVLNDSGGAGPGLQIATQRFVVTLDARAGAGGLGFHERSRVCDDPAVGQYLHLPGGNGGPIPIDTVLGLVEASSAFPLAFGPKNIQHCFSGQKRDPRCPVDPEATGEEPFFDGGVFDNVPLGLGVSLALPRRPKVCPAEHDRGDIEFLYVDPERRRRGPAAGSALPLATGGPAKRGLASAFEFLENFVLVSRQYELQTAARYVFDRLFKQDLEQASPAEASRMARREQTRHDARLRLSSRFFPVVGNYLGAFGAFFAQSFRQHDFYVGIYDAIFGVAEAFCRGTPVTGAATEAQCIIRQVLDLERQLGISAPGSVPASYVLRELLRAEVKAWVGGGPLTNGLLAAIPPIDLDRLPAGAPANAAGQIKVMAALLAVNGALEREEAAAHASGDPEQTAKFSSENNFVAFVGRFRDRLGDLDAEGVRDQLSPAERRFVADPNAEMRVKLAEAAERQAEIEERERYELGTRAMAVAQLVLHSEPFRPSKGWDLDPSSIPDRRLTPGRAFARVLPYSVSGDFFNAGTSVEYRPGYWFAERIGIGLPVSPLIWQSRDGGRSLAAAGLALLLHFDSAVIPELQLGPRLTHTWTGLAEGAFGDVRPGAEIAAYLIAGKLRLSIGIDDFTRAGDTYHAWSMKLGLADLNGLFYWAVRFITG